jgi:tagatose-6-phosphate ketose/aldose isomerase
MQRRLRDSRISERQYGSMAASRDSNSEQQLNGRGRITHAEIRQQPELWATTVERVTTSNARDIVQGRAAVICGAGTSAYAASAVAASWMNATAIPTTDLLLYSKEDLFRLVPAFVSNGVLVSIARSGDSPESVGVIKRIKQMFPGVTHLAITCNEKGEMLRLPGVNPLVLDPRTNDRSLVMTSSFSNLLLAGMLVAQPDVLKQSLPSIAAAVNGAFAKFDALGRKLAANAPNRFMVLTSAGLEPVAREARLKVLEMTAGRIVAESETFLGVRHGPLSFLRPDSYVVAMLSSDPERRRFEEDLLHELQHKKLGHVIVVGATRPDSALGQDFMPAMAPNLPDELRGPFEIVFPQLLAYHLSLASDLDPDSPSPDGVITRVVQPFQLH